jgi:hypothetical protein
MMLKKKGELWVMQAPPGTPKLMSQQVKDMLEDFP